VAVADNMSSMPVPSPRSDHFSASSKGSIFYWGGITKEESKRKWILVEDLDSLYEFRLVDKWERHLLKGQHPPGVYDGSCAMVGNCLYMYGGLDKEGKRTGFLFELNLKTRLWKELSNPASGGPKKKRSCGMVNYNSKLILYGGRTDDGPTNELHVFDIKAGKGDTSYRCVSSILSRFNYRTSTISFHV